MCDTTLYHNSPSNLCLQLTERIDGIKIGFLKEGFEKCDDNVNSVVKAIIPQLEAVGATVDWVSIPEHFDGKYKSFILLVYKYESIGFDCMYEHKMYFSIHRLSK